MHFFKKCNSNLGYCTENKSTENAKRKVNGEYGPG